MVAEVLTGTARPNCQSVFLEGFDDPDGTFSLVLLCFLEANQQLQTVNSDKPVILFRNSCHL